MASACNSIKSTGLMSQTLNRTKKNRKGDGMQRGDHTVVKGVIVVTVAVLFVMGVTDIETYSWLKSLVSNAYHAASRAWHM